MPANPEALLLMASSQRDMEDWVQAIRRVIWAPFGRGTARSAHAHPLEPLPSGNHAPLPHTEPARSRCLRTCWLSHMLPMAADKQAVCPFLLPVLRTLGGPLVDQAGPSRGELGHSSKTCPLLTRKSCGLCVLPSVSRSLLSVGCV